MLRKSPIGMNMSIMAISFADLRFHLTIKKQILYR